MILKQPFRNNFFDYLFEDLGNSSFNSDHIYNKIFNNVDFSKVETNENDVVISFEIPGVKKEDIKLNFDKPYLNLESTSVTGKLYNYSYKLSNHLDIDNLTSTYENGLLQIRIPKKKEEKNIKQITIN